MKEIFLIYLWENKLLKGPFATAHGQQLEILHPGSRNTNAGPDFLNARIRLGDTLWAGNVEIHLNATDFYKHNHHTDKAYDNLILHVVYAADQEVYSASRQAIPTLEVRGKFDESILLRYRSFIDSKHEIACAGSLNTVQPFTVLAWLDRMMAARLEKKTMRFQAILEQTGNDWEEVTYRVLMSNFGFKVNELPCEMLSASLPFRLLLKHADQLVQLEALLLGQAGLLSGPFTEAYPIKLQREYAFLAAKYHLKPLRPELWKFLRMRPANFPTIRLAQMAALIHANGQVFSTILASRNKSDLDAVFSVCASSYWDTHFRFEHSSGNTKKRLGQEAINLLIINSVVQLLFAYGQVKGDDAFIDKALLLLEEMPPESNIVTKLFGPLGIKASNALQSQALLHLKNEYCKPKQCLDCQIGHVLIKSNS